MVKQLYKDSLSELAVSRALIDETRRLMKQKRDGAPRRARIIRYASLAACFAVILFAVVAAPEWANRLPSGNSFLNPPPTASASSGQPSPTSGEIRINQYGDNMDEQQPLSHGPMVNRTEEWTFEQFCDLLGFAPLPAEVPQGLTLIENDERNIYFHDDRRVDFYNTWRFDYTSGAEAKSISVFVNPSSIPYWSVPRGDFIYDGMAISDTDKISELAEKSQINGTEVTIWHKDKCAIWNYMDEGLDADTLEVTDYYCADFEYQGAGFTVTAQNGITQDEFVQVLSGIIK
ncbi:MAG: hypothetical protein AB7D36_02015 [Oscillospiraceae bacterium]